MNKTLHNRIQQAEQAARFRPQQHQRSGMAAVYELINNPDRIRTPQLKQLVQELRQ